MAETISASLRHGKKTLNFNPIITANNLSKRYRLGLINRRTFRDELKYNLLRLRGKDPSRELLTVGREAGADGDFWALKDVSFEVGQGEVVGVIGGNGTGKSTLLKLLTRITEPTSGSAVIRGRVGSLLEVGTGFHPELTGRENIYMNGTILGMKKREIDAKFDEIVDFSGVEKFIDTPVKRYSSGMYVRLAFAVAAHLEPEVLLIDEVLAVGDADFQKKCLGKMGEISREGRTILFVSHNMAAVRDLCHRCVYLRGGRVNAIGETDQLVAAYLAEISIQPRISFPVNCDKFGVMVNDIRLISQENSLLIEMDIMTNRFDGELALEADIRDSNGTLLSRIKGWAIGACVAQLEGSATLSMCLPKLETYLSGGRYRIDVALTVPHVVKVAVFLNTLQHEVIATKIAEGVFRDSSVFGPAAIDARGMVHQKEN